MSRNTRVAEFRLPFATWVIGWSLLLAACAVAEPSSPSVAPPLFVAPPTNARAGVALVLSGGSARGFAHLGVLKVLEANGLKPDLIVGCSAGSVIGALYASGLSAREVESAMEKLDWRVFGDIAVPGLGLLTSPLGLVRGEGLHQFIDSNARQHLIERFPIPFAAVATDLGTGEAVIFNAGDAGLAVSASSAIPGLITPARIGGRLYSDCLVSSPLPVHAARRLGARSVIAVDVIYPPADAGLTGAIRVVFQALNIATFRLKEWELSGADVVIQPDLPRTSGQFGFSDREMISNAGMRATESMVPRIRELFAR